MAKGKPSAAWKKPKKPRATLEPVSEDGNSKFARALGSTDYHTREAGLNALTLWLCSRTELAEADMLKIWKGLFFCFWHSDKAPVQEELAQRLATILPKLDRAVGQLYFCAFMRTMQREWHGIDRLRLDKFLVLVRCFVRALFGHLRSSGWDPEVVSAHMAFLRDEVLLSGEAVPALGLSLHVADVALTELRGACDGGGGAAAVPWPALRALLEPFGAALAATGRPALMARVRDGVFCELAEGAGAEPAFAELDGGALSADLFALGARAGVRARNREALYTLSRAFERRGGKRARRGDGAAADPALAAAAGSDPAPHGGPSEAAELAQPGANSGRAAKTALEPDAAEAAGAGAAACEAASGAGAAQPAAPSGAVGAGGERGAAADACDGAAPAPRKAKGRKRREEAAQGAAGAAPAGGGASDVPEPKPGRKRKGAPARVRGVDGHLEVVHAAGPRDAAAAKTKRKHVSASAPGSAGAAQANGAPAQAAATQLGEPACGERGAASADGAASLPAPSQTALGERDASAKPASGAAAPPPDQSGKKKKKRKSGQAAVPAAGAAQAGGTPAGPALAKKRTKRGTAEKASAGATAGAGGVQGAAGAVAACRTAPAADAAGEGSAAAAAAAAAAARTKRVKFALSRNLAHSFGGPVPPADVRTPPGAQPKGSALKAGAAAGSGKGFRRLSAPGRLGGPDAEKRGKGQSRLASGAGGSAVRRLAARSPKAIPRAQAAQFF